jgi:hypothetical protein
MNQKILAVKTALEKVDAIAARRGELEAEQKALQPKIQKLTARVANGDAKSVNDLAIATARSAFGVPNDLKSVEAEFDAAIHELRQTLIPLGPMVARAYGAERKRVEAIVTEFLQTHMSDPDHGHEVEQLTARIVDNSNTIRPLDYLNTRFSATHINQQRLAADSVIGRARDAVKSLSNIE